MPSSLHSKEKFSIEFSSQEMQRPKPSQGSRRASPVRPARPPTVRSPRHSSCWPVRRSPPRLSVTYQEEVVKQSQASQQEVGEDSAVREIVPTEEVLDNDVDAACWRLPWSWDWCQHPRGRLWLLAATTHCQTVHALLQPVVPTCWTRSSLTWGARPRTPRPRTPWSPRAIPSPCRQRSISPLWTSFNQKMLELNLCCVAPKNVAKLQDTVTYCKVILISVPPWKLILRDVVTNARKQTWGILLYN